MPERGAVSPGVFDLSGRVAVITGGAGLLGVQHARAIASAGGIPVLADLDGQLACVRASEIDREFGVQAKGYALDITSEIAIQQFAADLIDRFGRVDILINNAANNPKMESREDVNFSRFENFPLEQWSVDLSVGITGTFLCCKVIGAAMAQRGAGVILNIASDLALIGPDQRIYREDHLPEHLQPVKPVTYSVVKSALVGLTRYLATYWAARGVRINAICPGGVFNGQPEEFVNKLTNLIPLGRMANIDEYQGAIMFLCSDASSYMTGSILTIDGGRTCW